MWNYIKNTLTYLIAIGCNRGMSLLLTPLLALYLSPSDFGYLGIASVIISLLKVFIGFNPSLFIIGNYYSISRESLAKYISHILVILVITLVIVLVFFGFFSEIFKSNYDLNFSSLLIISLTAFLVVIEGFVLVEIQMEKNVGKFLRISMISAFSQLVFSIFTVVILGWGWKGKILGDFFSSLIVTGIAFFYLYQSNLLIFDFSFIKTRTLLRFSLPLLPHQISLWIISFSDRFFIEKYLNMTDVGIYSIAYNFGLGLSLLYDAMQRVWQPYFFEHLHKEKLQIKALIILYTWIYYIGTFVIWLVSILAASKIIMLLFGAEYVEVINYIPLIFLGYTFQGMYRVVAGYFYYINRNDILATITFLSAVLNIVLNVILIQKNGALGAAQATMITYLFCFVAVQISAMKSYKMPWFSFFRLIKEPHP